MAKDTKDVQAILPGDRVHYIEVPDNTLWIAVQPLVAARLGSNPQPTRMGPPIKIPLPEHKIIDLACTILQDMKARRVYPDGKSGPPRSRPSNEMKKECTRPLLELIMANPQKYCTREIKQLLRDQCDSGSVGSTITRLLRDGRLGRTSNSALGKWYIADQAKVDDTLARLRGPADTGNGQLNRGRPGTSINLLREHFKVSHVEASVAELRLSFPDMIDSTMRNALGKMRDAGRITYRPVDHKWISLNPPWVPVTKQD
jgi:hypothetical protein